MCGHYKMGICIACPKECRNTVVQILISQMGLDLRCVTNIQVATTVFRGLLGRLLLKQ